QPSLIIMDIKLQGPLDGLQTAREIRRRYAIPVVMLTAHADEATIERAIGSHPFAYIIKPFEERELRTTVAVALARHRMERAIADREKLLGTTLNSIGEGVVVTDTEGRVTFANPVALSVVGAAPDGIVGKDFASTVQFRRRAANGIRGALPADVRDELVTLDGRAIPVEKTVTPLLDDSDSRVGTVWVFRDVSQRVASETALEESREQLRQAQKMEAIGRLSGGIAHDFNNLLTAILGYTKLVGQILDSEEEIDRDTVRQDIEGIEAVAQRSVSLTRQLLTFSRRQYAEPEVLDLNAVVGNLDGMIRRLLSEDIQLRVSLTADPAAVWTDRGQLEQVVLNLTVNARDAMPEGGVLSILTSTEHIDSPRNLRAGELKRGSYVRLEVSDTGVGMSPDIIDKIFEPFFTTKEVDTGTGLGLSTVYGIVRQAKGALDVQSDGRSGSTFRVFFPLSSGEALDGGFRPETNEEYLGTESILLVERDSHVLGVLGRALRSAGYQVVGVSNPGEAILVVEEARTGIDLLVTDVVMPHIDGIRLAERVNRTQPGLKVVLLSGYSEQLPDSLPDGLSVEFLQKPFEPGDFLRRVRTLLDA
ncbi:MAG: response regulator, partial [Spirochaetota bacterium]